MSAKGKLAPLELLGGGRLIGAQIRRYVGDRRLTDVMLNQDLPGVWWQQSKRSVQQLGQLVALKLEFQVKGIGKTVRGVVPVVIVFSVLWTVPYAPNTVRVFPPLKAAPPEIDVARNRGKPAGLPLRIAQLLQMSPRFQ